MAFLQVIKGSAPGQIFEITAERMVLGRHPNCEIVLDNAAVSRHHAQILESHGNYFLEDLRSRNRTYLNGEAVEGRIQLDENDELSVCNVMFRFHRRMPTPHDSVSAKDLTAQEEIGDHERGGADTALPEGIQALAVGDEPSDDVDAESSSLVSTVSTTSSSQIRLDANPEAKLRAVLEIGHALAHVLKLDAVLQKTLESLFAIFPQADEGFVLLKDPVKKKLIVRATKSRRNDDGGTVQISMTIVKQAMETGEAILSADAVKDPRFEMSESLSAMQIRSMMCVPLLSSSGDVLGVLQIDTKDVKQQFTKDDLEVLVGVGAQASLAVENAGLHEELLQQRDVQRELEVATQIQLGFLPSQRPKIAGYEFADYYEAAMRVGGDYFDYITLPDGRVAVALGDVAGKGVPAALLMARLYSSARFHLSTHSSAGEALNGLNAEIASSGLGHRFITFVVALLDPRSHEITIANAGHLPPLLRDPQNGVTRVGQEVSGMPLGVIPRQDFQEVKLALKPGATLILYTDGISEAMNPKHELYTPARLVDYLARAPESLDKVVDGIMTDVEGFSQGRPQRDDICVVGVRRCP